VRLGFYITGSATATYADLIGQVEELDDAGFHSVWLRERHFHRDHGGRNFFSSPLIVAAHLAQRTKNVRLGLGARILPLDHPLRIAEDVATVDVLSGGRVDFGIARIGEQELYQQAFGTSGEHARARFEEALDIIVRAWSGEPLGADGEHWSFDEIRVGPRPIQRPHPPIFLVGLSESTMRWGAARGYPLLLAAAQRVALVRETQERYRQLLAEHGRPSVSLPLNRFIYVADSDEQAADDIREAVMAFISRPNTVIRDFLGLEPHEITFERLLDEVFIVGSPATCLEKIVALHEDLDVEDLLLTFNYFTLDHDICLASMRRFLDEVRPQLAGRVAPAALVS